MRWGNNISTVEGIQYSGVLASVLWGGGDNISTVKVIQYSGYKNLKYHEFPKNLEIFSRAYYNQIDHIAGLKCGPQPTW